MRLPSELVEISSIDEGFPADLRWCLATERRMHAIIIILVPELFKLSVQVTDIPENYMIEKLAA